MGRRSGSKAADAAADALSRGKDAFAALSDIIHHVPGDTYPWHNKDWSFVAEFLDSAAAGTQSSQFLHLHNILDNAERRQARNPHDSRLPT